MAEVRTRTRLWFGLAVVLFIVGVVVVHGTAQAIVEAAAAAVFLAACIRFVGLAVRDDPTSTQILSRGGLIGGVTSGLASMAADEDRPRHRRTAAPRDADDEPADG